MQPSLRSASPAFELDESTLGASATSGGDEAAWIESERGRPLQTRTARQAARIEALFGRRFRSVVPTDDEWRATLHPDDADRVVAAFAAGRNAGTFDTTYRIVTADGLARTVRDRVLVLADRWQLRVVSALEGDSTRPTSLATDANASIPDWLDVVLGEAIVRCDHAGRVLAAFGPTDLLPMAADALRGRSIADLVALPAAMRHAWSTAFDRALDTQRAQICAYRLDRNVDATDGTVVRRDFEARMMPLVDGGQAGAVVIAIRDVGERDRLRERLEQVATHDDATGLANLRGLRERLSTWMPPGGVDRATVAPVALLIVDLDRFKQSHDLHGRSIGDSLLRLAAQRIRREALRELQGRASDAHPATPDALDERLAVDDPSVVSRLVVARLGGDQFAVAWRIDETNGSDRGGARVDALASRLIAALGAPTRIAGRTLFVRASIGVALHPADASDAAGLFSQAESALKRAKLAGRNQFRRYGDDASARPGGSSLPPVDEAALRTALANDQFLLVYQPKFELATSLVDRSDEGDPRGVRGTLEPGAMIAVEALVRWRTPAGALLIPHDFIPLAEASGMIRPLGDRVLRTALAEVARFASHGAARVGVTVNVSLLQLHDRAFVQTVEVALRDAGFAPHELTLELAETAFVEDIRLVADALAELSALGVRLAIDHFGVGTAGLVALKSLPIDEIKIDRSFIAGAAIDAFDATIVSGLIQIAHDLGKTVTAEGVERLDQVASLCQMRCDAIQGYFVGEPMGAAALVADARLWRRTLEDRARARPDRPPTVGG